MNRWGRAPVSVPAWMLWAVASLLAACETIWLFGTSPGLGWGLSGLLTAAGFLCFRWLGAKNHWSTALPSLVLAMLLAAGTVVTADVGDAVLLAFGALWTLGSVVASDHARLRGRDGRSVLAAPLAAPTAVGECFQFLNESIDAMRGGRDISIARGVVLAVPVTIVLGLLLSQADPTFAYWRDTFYQIFENLSPIEWLFFLALLALILGICSGALRQEHERAPAAYAARPPREIFGTNERLIVLGSVAALFALFHLLQLSYLFGNPGGRTGSGISYAQAVHKGFSELNVASFICVVLLLVLARYGDTQHGQRTIRAFQWCVGAEALLLCVSAFHRVDVYEAAYGFTRLRVDVQADAVVLCIVLGLLMWELRARPNVNRLLRRALAVAAVTFMILVYGNSNARIVEANLQRYMRSGQLDVGYLATGLGPDAVPVLIRAIPSLPAAIRTRLSECLIQYYGDHEKPSEHWYEWDWRRVTLQKTLTTLIVPATGGVIASTESCETFPSNLY